ncbi:stage II sporulation protein P [Shouchella sp. JSM 1781072]|uniref:stage II sporulation protein P n=1 Tax=Bacillaceae TaxID=186817 RepID=UPI000C0850FD|nr:MULTISPECIES: stage II sporulation protein P [Bacillaceae]UTR07255.1 stage II sporulation protein P [Alkalihalobacillus sp. LMS6]
MNDVMKWLGSLSIMLLSTLLIISILATNQTWYNRGLNDMVSPLEGVDLLHLISMENPLYKQALPDEFEAKSVSNFFMNAATNLDFNHPLSLLSQGIPAMAAFDTRIALAGQGTDVTNMPRETLPPEDSLAELAKQHPNEEEESTERAAEDQEPSVLIYHTHSYESFLPELGLEGAENADQAISSDPELNIINVGKHFADRLSNHGIVADVDKTNMNAYMAERNMSNYYTASRQIIEEKLETQQYDLLLDFHRDSVRRDVTAVTINNETYARVFFVVGTAHPNADAQLATAKEFHNLIEEAYPGLSRGVFEKDLSQGNGIYNQDLADTAMLVEFGGVDNTMDEALRSADVVADLLADYYKETIQE